MDRPQDARAPQAAPASHTPGESASPAQPPAAGAISSLREQLGEAAYAERLSAKLGEYHFLITKEAAAHLLELEAAGPQARVGTLRQALLSPLPVMVRCRLERLFQPKLYEKNGQTARIQRMAVTDHSGPGTLVAYDKDCEPIDAQLLVGDLVQAGPVRSRGGELHLAPGGTLKRVQKGGRQKIVLDNAGKNASTIGNFEGVVTEFGGDFPVRKTNWKQNTLAGQAAAGAAPPAPGLMSSFILKDDSGSARVVWWNSPGLQGKLRVGMQAQVENGIRRGNEIHISEAGRLVFDAKPQEEEQKRPKIGKIEIETGETGAARVKVMAGEKIVCFFSLEEACAKMGAGPVPEGVDAATIVELKKSDWMGKPLPLSWEEKSK